MKMDTILEANSLQEAFEALRKDKANAILGGAVWLKQMNRAVKTGVDLSRLGLDTIETTRETVRVGAMVTLRDFETHPSIADIGGGFLVECVQTIMGVALRNIATVGGSVMGRFGFSDFLTALHVLDVSLEFYPGQTLSLEAFLHGKDRPDGILTHLVIRRENGRGYFRKNANTLLDFARLNVAVFKGDDGFRIAVGSRPGVAIRARETMEGLNAATKIGKSEMEAAMNELLKHVKLGDNNRASADYRRAVAVSYVKRGIEAVTDR